MDSVCPAVRNIQLWRMDVRTCVHVIAHAHIPLEAFSGMRSPSERTAEENTPYGQREQNAQRPAKPMLPIRGKLCLHFGE